LRKSAILTMLLLGLAAVFLYSAHAWVDAEKAAVSIEETVIYGDKSVAQGISLKIRTHCNYRLFWDTHYTVGESPEISTDFSFSQAEQMPSRNIPYAGIYFDGTFNGYGAGSSGAVGLDMTNEAVPVRDVASRAAPGETRTEVVRLSDYYQFYPIQVEFDRPSGFAVNADTQKLFADYFRVPIYPEHQVEISIEKDGAGEVRSLSLSTSKDSGVFLETPSVVTDNGCFFTFSCRTAGGKLLDTSFIAGGYGIYHFPLHNQRDDDRTLDIDELQMVYPIDAEVAEAVDLRTNADQSKLFLVTRESDGYMLTVIDAQTMAQLQKLAVLPAAGDSGFGCLHIYEDFLVPVLGDGRFALLAASAEGVYQTQFAADFGSSQELRYIFSRDVSMDYDGERLAVAAFQNGWFAPKNNCGFYLAVYDRTGLMYAGNYEHNLDRSLIEHPLTCLPLDDAALTVIWGD